MKRIAIAGFTERGLALAVRLAGALRSQARTGSVADATGGEALAGGALFEAGLEVTVHAPRRLANPHQGIDPIDSLDEWCGPAFAGADALVFVGACGIAVRVIAPYVRDKFTDPAVVAIDEWARFAVPLLSGHVGRANDLARWVAHATGAVPVVSTATDVNGVFAVDEWARERGLVICDRALAKKVSAELLAGGKVGFASDVPVLGDLPAGLVSGGEPLPELGIYISFDEDARPFAETLPLVPHIAAVGIGCRRGVAPEVLENAVVGALDDRGIPLGAVRTIASIDVKRAEPAIIAFARNHGLCTRFFTADELNAVPGDFASSDFVRETVGTGNVCERAAVAASGGGRLIMGKSAGDGVTVACAVPRGFSVAFPEARHTGDTVGETARQNGGLR